MDTLETKVKKNSPTPFRVSLGSEAVKRITHWEDQIKQNRKGVRIKPSDIVEFVILSHSEDLSSIQIRDFQDRFVSEVELAKWAIKELTAAEKRGDKISLSDLLATASGLQAEPRRSRKRGPQKNDADVSASEMPGPVAGSEGIGEGVPNE